MTIPCHGYPKITAFCVLIGYTIHGTPQPDKQHIQEILLVQMVLLMQLLAIYLYPWIICIQSQLITNSLHFQNGHNQSYYTYNQGTQSQP